MRYLLGVDGGGTKTEFGIRCVETGEQKNFTAGSSNYKSVGMDSLRTALQDGLAWMEQEKIDKKDIAYAVFGMSGCDSEEDYRTIMNEITAAGMPEEKTCVCNDGVLAFYAQTSAPGIVVIAGTGSIVMGVDRKGGSVRCGGWGAGYSDIGSGYWIGCEALKSTLLYCDGCIPYSPLHESVREYCKAENFEDLPFKITAITEFPQIAKTALLVIRAAEAGVQEAKEILDEGFSILADQVGSVYRRMRLSEEEKIQIVYSGSIWKSEYCKQLLTEKIQERLENVPIGVIEAVNAPVYGGIRMAGERAGLDGR